MRSVGKAASVLLLLLCAGQLAGLEGSNGPYERGKTALARREYQAAAKWFDEAIRSGEQEKGLRRCRAFARLLSGDPRGAIADFDVAAQADPQSAVLYYGRGAAYRILGESEKAIADLSQAIQLDPKYRAAYSLRAEVFKDTGYVNKAIADRNSELELRATSSDAPDNENDLVAGRRVDLDQFMAYPCWVLLFKARRNALNPARNGCPRIENSQELAVRYATEGQLDKALQTLDALIAKVPRDARAYLLRGAVQGCRGQPFHANADFNTAYELNPNDLESSFLSAQTNMDALEKINRGELPPAHLIREPRLRRMFEEFDRLEHAEKDSQ